jgi:hypothetical protein
VCAELGYECEYALDKLADAAPALEAAAARETSGIENEDEATRVVFQRARADSPFVRVLLVATNRAAFQVL